MLEELINRYEQQVRNYKMDRLVDAEHRTHAKH
jgi:hypothetical protein